MNTIKGKPGPHTAHGKERSKKNSAKHGVLAIELFLLPGEQRAKFDLLRQSYRELFDVVGPIEELLADEIAMSKWREVRVVYAESVQIARVLESRVPDLMQTQAFPPRVLGTLNAIVNGLLGDASPMALESAIKVLGVLRGDFEERGYDEVADLTTLTRVYGFHVLNEGFPGRYLSLGSLAGDADERKNRSVDQAEVQKEAIATIEGEIGRIGKLLIDAKKIELRRRDFDAQALVFPPPEVADLFMRYETHFGRHQIRLEQQLADVQAIRRLKE